MKCRPVFLIGFVFAYITVYSGFCQQTVIDPLSAPLRLHPYQSAGGVVPVENNTVYLQKVKFVEERGEGERAYLAAINRTDKRVIYQQRLILGIVFAGLIIAIFAWLRLRKLFRKVKAMNQQIALQNKELAELNGTRTKIFSVIAHDLRNPLTQLVALMQLIESGVIGPDELGTLIPSLNRSVYQTLNITDNLLMWAKSQMNGYKVKLEAVNLDQLCQEVVEDLRTQIEAKQLAIDMSALDRLPAWADVEMVRIVVRNLVTNAIKFTPFGGGIALTLTGDRDLIVLEITDSGVGMSLEQLEYLFSFDIRSTRGTGNERGSGLGLKICADLLKINNARICVKSELGRGSTFFVTLPRDENANVVLPAAEHIFVASGQM